ncbi:MAG TPA: efflux RND transporter periplasmic adaptor subunit [Nitrospiria bacterium]|nr:efflux RND transporter periplasmic adaptor subunit [Nitrospiria bacterium]
MILLLLGIIVMGAAGIYTLRHSSSAAKNVPVPRSVSVVKVTRGDLTQSIHLTAELVPYQDIDVYAKVAGYLESIHVDIGDRVKAGQVIATLELPEQRADYEKTKVDFEIAKLDYDRLAAVARKKPGLVAQQEIDNTYAALNVAKARMTYAQTILGYGVITAPFDGVITKRWANTGALIQTGTSSNTAVPLVKLAQITKLRLAFPVPESAISRIHVGIPVSITIGATGQTLQGKIARFAHKLDDATRTMNAEADLDNSNLRLTPGMYASVDLTLESKENVLVVPPQAVSGEENPTVLLVNSHHKTEERPVKLGLQTTDKVEILTGLAEGDLVVFGSRSSLEPGMPINPKPAGVDQ